MGEGLGELRLFANYILQNLAAMKTGISCCCFLGSCHRLGVYLGLGLDSVIRTAAKDLIRNAFEYLRKQSEGILMIGFCSNSLVRRKVLLRREMTSFCPHCWSIMFVQHAPRDGGVRDMSAHTATPCLLTCFIGRTASAQAFHFLTLTQISIVLHWKSYKRHVPVRNPFRAAQQGYHYPYWGWYVSTLPLTDVRTTPAAGSGVSYLFREG